MTNFLQPSLDLTSDPKPPQKPVEQPCASPGCHHPGIFGKGVRLRAGRPGTWFCREHWTGERNMEVMGP